MLTQKCLEGLTGLEDAREKFELANSELVLIEEYVIDCKETVDEVFEDGISTELEQSTAMSLWEQAYDHCQDLRNIVMVLRDKLVEAQKNYYYAWIDAINA